MKSHTTLKLIVREKIIIESFLLTILLGLVALISYLLLPKAFVNSLVGITALCTASIHGVYRKNYLYIIIAIISISAAMIIGTVVSQLPIAVPFCTLMMGGLTFYLPTKFRIMPEILTKFCFIGYVSSAFGYSHVSIGITLTCVIVVMVLLILYYALINILLYRDQPYSNRERIQDKYHHVMLIALASLAIGYLITNFMTIYLPNTNPWWIMMTIVLVLGYSYEKVKITALKRGFANILGPIIIAILMTLLENHYYLQIALLLALFFLVNCSISYYLLLNLFVSCMIISWSIITLSSATSYTIALDRAFETFVAVFIVLIINEIYKRLLSKYINKIIG
ncbi:FUSC family protein [Francisella salina]|uniref:FUSC family protein n=1 Tax=Francisella salina TaxID=573569 RepID=UPI00059DF46A|nr:FUSC family protein [Francisella salina]